MPKLLDTPLPTVEGLNEYDELLLDEQGEQSLVARVNYEGITERDEVGIYFYGCGPEGQVSDVLFHRELEAEDIHPQLGYTLTIDRNLLDPINNGRAFFSYTVNEFAPIGARSSPRRFFYIGTRGVRPEVELPVVDVWPSHTLEIDFNSMPASLQVVVMPYASHTVGDRVIVQWVVYGDDGQEEQRKQYNKVLMAADVGRPLAIPVPMGDLILALGRDSRVHYQVQHAGQAPGDASTSVAQQFAVVERAPSTPLLAPPKVVGHPDETIFDPSQFPDGMPIEVSFDAGMRTGDWVLLDVAGNGVANSLRLSHRLDPSNVATAAVRLVVPQRLLTLNVGADLAFSYHHSRWGLSRSSEALRASVRRPLNMPLVQVPGAVDNGAANQYKIDTSQVYQGARVLLPDAFQAPAGAAVAVHWVGEEHFGSVVLEQPDPSAANTYNVPKRYIPSNLGLSVEVYYTATEPGQAPHKSAVLSLLIVAPAKDTWPTLQCERMKPNGDLLLSENPNGTVLSLAPWAFIRADHRLRVRLAGIRASNGAPFSTDLLHRAPTFPEVVGGVQFPLSRADLLLLRVGDSFTLETSVSFDGDKTFIDFNSVRGRLLG